MNDAVADARSHAQSVLRNAVDAVHTAVDHAAKAVAGPTRD
jgi:hypothetical protein